MGEGKGRSKEVGISDRAQPPGCRIDGSALDGLLQDVIKETLGRLAGSPLGTERRPLLHFSQGGQQRAVQLSCVGSFHFGFDNELVARFLDGALRRQFRKSVP